MSDISCASLSDLITGTDEIRMLSGEAFEFIGTVTEAGNSLPEYEEACAEAQALLSSEE
jgi:hypothetical protein